MAKEILEKENMESLLKTIPYLVRLSKAPLWLDYDTDADVMYLHFEEKPSSTHSEMQDDGIILDYKGNRLVGVTIPDASHR